MKMCVEEEYKMGMTSVVIKCAGMLDNRVGMEGACLSWQGRGTSRLWIFPFWEFMKDFPIGHIQSQLLLDLVRFRLVWSLWAVSQGTASLSHVRLSSAHRHLGYIYHRMIM